MEKAVCNLIEWMGLYWLYESYILTLSELEFKNNNNNKIKYEL